MVEREWAFVSFLATIQLQIIDKQKATTSIKRLSLLYFSKKRINSNLALLRKVMLLLLQGEDLK